MLNFKGESMNIVFGRKVRLKLSCHILNFRKCDDYSFCHRN